MIYSFISQPVYSIDIKIDGVLDDSDWSSAREWTKYYESMPFSLSEPKHYQKVLIQQDEKGMYFGFINEQPRESIRANRHERDDEMANADKAGLAIDFDGDGLTAYGFTVSAGGSISDGIYRNENDVNYDWDADWDSATSISDEGWYAEIFIPWSVAPMKAQEGNIRKVKLSFWRMVANEWRVNTSIKGNPRQEKFMSLFHEMNFNNYSISKIDFFPFINVTEDRVLEEIETKTGAEIFWKIDSGKQLNMALNPDFGQVESDELVVNFTSSETFYADKRPFFSENNALFDVKGYRFFSVINTRRVGAAPDYNCSNFSDSLKTLCESNQTGITDIDYAVRYTQQNKSFDFGFLGASEADEQFSQGKDFYSVRARKNSDNYSIGYLGTYTDRPVLDRNADVHSLDLVYRPSDKLRIDTIFITSKIDQRIGDINKSGDAFRFRLVASPRKGRWHDVGIFFFDEDTDINDMGYQITNNWLFAGNQNGLKFSDFDESSIFLSQEYEVGLAYEANADLNKSSHSTYLTFKSTFKNTSFIEFTNFYRPSSKDFWVTRGNVDSPYIKKPENYGTMFQFKGPSKDFFNYFIEVKREKGSQWSFSALGVANSLTAKVDFSPKDNLNFSLMHQHVTENNWLNWIQDNLLGIYKNKRQRTTVASLNWFGGDKHELRMKAQMVAFTARQPRAYLGDISGSLNPLEMELPPFSLSDLAFQVRYRYEIMPLAYLYVVYTKGGRVIETDEEDSLNELYKRPWKNPQADSFTVKVRYRF
tara:strand:- start:6347 stop:8632 length:2286 start_codon:yes stop_codon:yes gene_type:complete